MSDWVYERLGFWVFELTGFERRTHRYLCNQLLYQELAVSLQVTPRRLQLVNGQGSEAYQLPADSWTKRMAWARIGGPNAVRLLAAATDSHPVDPQEVLIMNSPTEWYNDEIMDYHVDCLNKTFESEGNSRTRAVSFRVLSKLNTLPSLSTAVVQRQSARAANELMRQEELRRLARWSKSFKLVDVEVMIFPMLKHGNHWTVVIWVRENRQLEYFDTMNTGRPIDSSNERWQQFLQDFNDWLLAVMEYQIFRGWLTEEEKPALPTKVVNKSGLVPQQGDINSCGPGACLVMEHIGRRAEMNFTFGHMIAYRAVMLHQFEAGRMLRSTLPGEEVFAGRMRILDTEPEALHDANRDKLAECARSMDYALQVLAVEEKEEPPSPSGFFVDAVGSKSCTSKDTLGSWIESRYDKEKEGVSPLPQGDAAQGVSASPQGDAAESPPPPPPPSPAPPSVLPPTPPTAEEASQTQSVELQMSGALCMCALARKWPEKLSPLPLCMRTHPALSIGGAMEERSACATLGKADDHDTASLAPTEPEGDVIQMDVETIHSILESGEDAAAILQSISEEGAAMDEDPPSPPTGAHASGSTSLFEPGMGYDDSAPPSTAQSPSVRNSPALNTRAGARRDEQEQTRAAQAPRASPRLGGARVPGLCRGQGKSRQKK